MADVHEPKVRSYNMSRVKGKDTKPEMKVRRYLHRKGFRYNLHGKFRGTKLPGRPDLVLPAYKTVIFVHGCFWHAHKGCRYFKIPETREEWWREKLMGNRERDLGHIDQLESKGWKVIVIWTCQLKKDFQKTMRRAIQELNDQR